MGFANERTEMRRLLLLTASALSIELVLMSGSMFKLLTASAEWPALLQLLVLFLPRFVVMLALVLMFGPFWKGLWFSGFLATYMAPLVVRFYQAEAFVDWSSMMAASRATLPYAAGVVGTVLAFWLRRNGQTMNVSASNLNRLSSSAD